MIPSRVGYWPYQQRLERPTSDKHCSLLGTVVMTTVKKFYNIGPRSQTKLVKFFIEWAPKVKKKYSYLFETIFFEKKCFFNVFLEKK
jgi:hypothetical protein